MTYNSCPLGNGFLIYALGVKHMSTAYIFFKYVFFVLALEAAQARSERV